MKFELASEWPLWLLPFCLLLGFGVGYYLYFFRKKTDDISLNNLRILFVVRSFVISLIAFLLIAPFVISREPNVEEPILLIAEDRSQSVLHLTDSVDLENFIQKEAEGYSELTDKFEVHRFAFGEELRKMEGEEGFPDRVTDISNAIRTLEKRYENRNVAAMLLVSDGVFNKGVNPLYLPSDYAYPIYSIALGDTTIKQDARVAEVKNNKIAFLGNTFEVRLTVAADLMQGRETEIRITSNGKEYIKKPLRFSTDRFFESFKFDLPAEREGVQQFVAEVVPLSDEVSKTNNHKYFFVEVLKAQQKILILSDAPHPDVAALKSALSGSKNYKVEAKLSKDFEGEFEDYDCVILNQVPSRGHRFNTGKLKNSEVPVLYILGRSSDIAEFNKMSSGLELNRFNGSFNESSPLLNPSFQFFSTGKLTEEVLHEFPPLLSPFGSFDNTEGVINMLFRQKIGKVETNYPMIGFYESEGRKSGIITGEGIWRWKLHDYMMNGNNETFNSLFQKMIQYLAVREDRSRFRVLVEGSYFENENVIIDAEYYNKAYELNNDFPAQLKLKSEDNEVFEYDFLPLNNIYKLELGKLSPGTYQWDASLDDGLQVYSRNGTFSIKPLQLEMNASIANHNLLYNLSVDHGGKMFRASEIEDLKEQLLEDERYKPLIHYQEKFRELISLKWIFFLILALISFEWFYRKWLGLT